MGKARAGEVMKGSREEQVRERTMYRSVVQESVYVCVCARPLARFRAIDFSASAAQSASVFRAYTEATPIKRPEQPPTIKRGIMRIRSLEKLAREQERTTGHK